MSLKKIEQVKKDKGLRIWDLIIYGAIAVIVAVLFIVIFTTRDTSPLSGVRVYSNNALVFEYDFSKKQYKNYDESAVSVEEVDGGLSLKVTYGDGYNKVLIDFGGSVTVTEADCFGKDCVTMKDITDNSGFIYCSPHRLKIEPYDFSPDNKVII